MKLTKKQIQTRRKWADALQSSAKFRGSLYNLKQNTHCCLGVYANSVCGIDNIDIGEYTVLSDYSHARRHRVLSDIMDDVGIDMQSESFFVHLNDILDWPHADIGLYLYMTCEAGEAFEYDLNN